MAEARPQRKPLYWVGSSRRAIRELPDDVKDVFGFALHQAQLGEKHIDAKPLRGFAGGVLEIRADDEGNTFRAVLRRSISIGRLRPARVSQERLSAKVAAAVPSLTRETAVRAFDSG